MKNLIVTMVAAGLLLGAVPVAQAAPSKPDPATARAKDLFDKAETEFALGHFTDALAAYEEAYRAKPLPEFLYNVGQCHRYLGNWDKAQVQFRMYLNRKPGAENRATVEKLIVEMEGKARGGPSQPTAVEFVPGPNPAGAPPLVVGPGGVPTGGPAPQTPPAGPPAYGSPAGSPPPSEGSETGAPAYGAPPPAGYAPVPPPGYAPTGAPPPGMMVVAPPPQGGEEPLTHKWWFWGAIGAAVVVVVIVGVAASSSGGSTPSGSLGTVDLR